MEVSESKQLRMLEDESRELKRLLAGSLLDNAVPKSCWQKMTGLELAGSSGKPRSHPR
jgi:hypothetical protein